MNISNNERCTSQLGYERIKLIIIMSPEAPPGNRPPGNGRYYETLHMPDDEPVAEVPVDWAFDKSQPWWNAGFSQVLRVTSGHKWPKTAPLTELPRFTPTKRNLQNYIYAELGALEMWEKMVFGVSLWFKFHRSKLRLHWLLWSSLPAGGRCL